LGSLAAFRKCILDCGGIHVTATAFISCTWRSMQNAAKISSNIRKKKLTFMYEFTIKKCLPEWDSTTPLMKK